MPGEVETQKERYQRKLSATVSPTSILIVFRQLCLEELGGQPRGCKGAGHDLETKQQQHGFVHFCHVSTVRSYVIKGIICDKKKQQLYSSSTSWRDIRLALSRHL